MSGVFGFVGTGSPTIAAKMAARSSRLDASTAMMSAGLSHAIGAAGPRATACIIERENGVALALCGHPILEHDGQRLTVLDNVAAALCDSILNEGRAALAAFAGDFVFAFVDPSREYALLAVDRMGIRNLVYAVAARTLVFGPDCDSVACHPDARREIDPQQIYSYVYFHMVPGPATIYRDLLRVAPGQCVEFANGTATVHRYWQMSFDERAPARFAELRTRFRQTLDTAVATNTLAGTTGTFLSGGTDSSTISGLLARQEQRATPAFSIGFDAPGYDEMDYAGVAAAHFGLEHHAYYVTPQDVVSAVPRIAEAYDQPFGNASAVPTLYCAMLAREHGVTRLLAGDGGDELFGGNSRYAKQRQFSYYERIPGALRRALIEPIARAVPDNAPRVLRKGRSYVEQASLPMPDRYESYNLLRRLGADAVFTDDFLASIDPEAALSHQRHVFRDTDATSFINRMLAFDFQFTLADNDLPKVTRMCELAGIDVAFPMLDDGVVAFSAALAPDWKLRGTRLRYFFKRALADFLPPQVIAKEKHGFGLPFGVWLKSDARLRELAGDSLGSIRARGFIRPEFVARLLERDVAIHAEYFGAMVWILMMLEQWYQRPTKRATACL